MRAILMLIVGIVYTLIAISYTKEGNAGLGLSFFCYAVANFGIYMSGLK